MQTLQIEDGFRWRLREVIGCAKRYYSMSTFLDIFTSSYQPPKGLATNPFITFRKAVETSQYIALDDPTNTGVLTCVLHSGSKPGKDNNISLTEVFIATRLARARGMNRTPRKLSMLKRCLRSRNERFCNQRESLR